MDGLGLKITMQAGGEVEGTWCNREACIEAKQSHEGGVSI